MNESVGKPLIVRAVITAEVPGIGTTSICSLIALEINLTPGSEIAGVPASETNAQFSPDLILLITFGIFFFSLTALNDISFLEML